jgi:hypothetical protein
MSDSYERVVSVAARKHVALCRQFQAARVYARLLAPGGDCRGEGRGGGVFRVLGFLAARAITAEEGAGGGRRVPFTMDVTVRELLDAWVSLFYEPAAEGGWRRGTYLALLRQGLFPAAAGSAPAADVPGWLVPNMASCTLPGEDWKSPRARLEDFVGLYNSRWMLDEESEKVPAFVAEEEEERGYRMRFRFRKDAVPHALHYSSFCLREAHALFLYLGEILFSLSYQLMLQKIEKGEDGITEEACLGCPSAAAFAGGATSPRRELQVFFKRHARQWSVDVGEHGFFAEELLDTPLSTLVDQYHFVLQKLDAGARAFFGFCSRRGDFRSAWSSWSLACGREQRQAAGLGPCEQSFGLSTTAFVQAFFARQRRVLKEINAKLQRITNVFAETRGPVSALRVLESSFISGAALAAMDVCARGSLREILRAFGEEGEAARDLAARVTAKEESLAQNLKRFNASVHDFATNSPQLLQRLEKYGRGTTGHCVDRGSREARAGLVKLLTRYLQVLSAAEASQEDFVGLVARVNEHQDLDFSALTIRWKALLDKWSRMWTSRQEQFFVKSLAAVVRVKIMNIRSLEFCVEKLRLLKKIGPEARVCPQSLLFLENLDKVERDLQQLQTRQRVADLEKLCIAVTDEIMADVEAVCFNEFLRCRLQDLVSRSLPPAQSTGEAAGSSGPCSEQQQQPSSFLALFLDVAREKIGSEAKTNVFQAGEDAKVSAEIQQALRETTETYFEKRFGQIDAHAASAECKRHDIRLEETIDSFLQSSGSVLSGDDNPLVHRYFGEIHQFMHFCQQSKRNQVCYMPQNLFSKTNLRAFKKTMQLHASRAKRERSRRDKLLYKINDVNRFNALMLDGEQLQPTSVASGRSPPSNHERKRGRRDGRESVADSGLADRHSQSTRDIFCAHIYPLLDALVP